MPRRPWKNALLWLVLMGPLFFASYGLANAMAAAKESVPTLAYAWERQIPFLPWTIIPYWSIDLFYAASFFMCTNVREVNVHGKRLISAQLVAVTCFLLWPLRFSFERPVTDGIFGVMFDLLMGFDKPFNQAPSLHIVLLVILWGCYARYVRGVWRWVLHGWATLIGISVLTTWQHHVLDVPSGVLVGCFCLWLWPEDGKSVFSEWRWPRQRRQWLLGSIYTAAAGLCIGACMTWHACWPLLWPASAFALVALAYAGGGARVLQKQQDGRMPFAVVVLLAPYLMLAWANSRAWTRNAPNPVRVTEGVWLGRIPAKALPNSVHAIVDVCAELPCLANGEAYELVAMLDLVVPDAVALRQAADAIERHRSQGVLVCCALGYSRSAACVAAWLLQSGRASTWEQAVSVILKAQPEIVLNMEHRLEVLRVGEGDACAQ